jgi:hypothetical protein
MGTARVAFTLLPCDIAVGVPNWRWGVEDHERSVFGPAVVIVVEGGDFSFVLASDGGAIDVVGAEFGEETEVGVGTWATVSPNN